MVYENLIGMRFGRLLVTGDDAKRGHRNYVLVQCDCGTRKSVNKSGMKRGHIQSCGCLNDEAIAKSLTKHGMTHTVEHNTWKAIRQRCNNPNTAQYRDYGGRGITVCERWDSFENFIADMGMRPEGGTIDRIDNSQGYSPSNCRWATRTDQGRNTRSNVLDEDTVALIKTLRRYGDRPRSIASKLGVSWHAVKSVTGGVNWANVPGMPV